MHPVETSVIPHLCSALHRIRSTPPRIIASPATQLRRAAVALILRVRPSPSYPLPSIVNPSSLTLSQFFEQEWVNAPGARPELLFLLREKPDGAEGGMKGSSEGERHLAFPGGRMEEGDENGLYTAMRQTWEELGIDLAERCYTCIGQLDDREITTSLGKRLLMILSPFVFLQLSPTAPPPDPTPSTTLHWIPLSTLLPRFPGLPPSLSSRPNLSNRNRPQFKNHFRDPTHPDSHWGMVNVDAASRLAPKRSKILKILVRVLVGVMRFPAIVIDETDRESRADEKRQRARSPSETQLKLWGLSLGMTLDLISFIAAPPPPNPSASPASTLSEKETASSDSQEWLPLYTDQVAVLAPSLTSVLPRFGYPDVEFWIWVFGKRYREVVRGWETSVRTGGVNDRRINWPGQALSTFYASIRKALVVVIVVRAIALLLGLGGVSWWMLWRS